MKKFDKSIFNPFDYINPERIRNNVNKIKDRHPDWEKEDICRELVKRKSRICAGTGAISALPSSIPGLGTFVTIAGGTAVDLGTMVYFLSELTLEIATVYNRNPSSEATIKEALWVLSSCFGVESATLGVSKVAIINTSKKALAKIIEKLFTIIGGWLSKNILLRMLPLVGSLVNAYINSKACKHAGKEVVLWYKSNLEQDIEWTKTGEEEKHEAPEEGGEEYDDLPDENIIFEPMDEEMDMDFEREDFVRADETSDENIIDGEGETITEPDIDIEKLRTSDNTIEEPLPDIEEIEIDEKPDENIIDIEEIEILEETFEESPTASDREKDVFTCSKEEVKINPEEEVFGELKEEKNIEPPVVDGVKIEKEVDALSEEEEDSEEEMGNIDSSSDKDDKAEDPSDKNLTVEANSENQEKKKKFIKKFFKKKKKK